MEGFHPRGLIPLGVRFNFFSVIFDLNNGELPDEEELWMPEMPEELTDLSPDTHLDEEVAEERRQEKDLLDSAGPQE